MFALIFIMTLIGVGSIMYGCCRLFELILKWDEKRNKPVKLKSIESDILANRIKRLQRLAREVNKALKEYGQYEFRINGFSWEQDVRDMRDLAADFDRAGWCVDERSDRIIICQKKGE